MAAMRTMPGWEEHLRREDAAKECERHTAALHAVNETLHHLIERERHLVPVHQGRLPAKRTPSAVATGDAINDAVAVAITIAAALRDYATRPKVDESAPSAVQPPQPRGSQ